MVDVLKIQGINVTIYIIKSLDVQHVASRLHLFDSLVLFPQQVAKKCIDAKRDKNHIPRASMTTVDT